MNSRLVTFEEASKQITGSGSYLVAADEKVLKKLPKGNWIGGSIPYFMSQEGGVVSQNEVFITELPDVVKLDKIRFMNEDNISRIYSETPANGFTFLILPASTPLHLSFAMNSSNYPEFAFRPLLGWISGMHLNELGQTKPVVVNGQTGEVSDDQGVAMFIDLPQNYICDIGIVNIFEQGKGDSLKFPETGFSVKDVMVNGVTQNFAEYLFKNKVDTKNPLVANYGGAMINVSFQGIDEKEKVVNLYAPVFTNTEYKLAAPSGDYVNEFTKNIPGDAGDIAFSCNCILNFLYSELEGKKTGSITGPVTFGEIAFQLLNQTLVYIKINKADK